MARKIKDTELEADQTNGTFVSDVAALARVAHSVRSVPEDSGLIAVADGVRLTTEAELKFPGAKAYNGFQRHEKFWDPSSFSQYVIDYGSQNALVVFDHSNFRARAVVNYIPKSPERSTLEKSEKYFFPCDWFAELELQFTDMWQVLTRPRSEASHEIDDVFKMLNVFALLDRGDSRSGRVEDEDQTDVLANTLAPIFEAKYVQEPILETLSTAKDDQSFLFVVEVDVFSGANPQMVFLLVSGSIAAPVVTVLDRERIEKEAAQEVRDGLQASLRGEFGHEFSVYGGVVDCSSE